MAHSFAEALALAGPADEVFVCGGGQIYAEAMPWAHRMLITEVFLEPEGDVEFPPIPFDTFVETARDTREQLRGSPTSVSARTEHEAGVQRS